MALTFPNRSRSYDEAGRRIRFTGYDGMFQVAFLVEVDALTKSTSRGDGSEADHLAAFDAVREKVQTAAHKAYATGRRNNMYVLTPADLN